MNETFIASNAFLSLARDVLAKGHCLRFTARGHSMTPFVHDGDVLTIEPAAGKDIRAGDIAFYAAGGNRVVAHRVLRRWRLDGDLVILTRGDASTGAGERVSPVQILGRAVSVERGGREARLDTFWRRAAALAALKLMGLAQTLAGIRSRLTRRR